MADGGGSVAHRVAPSLSERTLLETVQRQLRAPARRMSIVLHLSRLTSPAPRPHHRRIARALLQESAQQHDGQVFSLGNGDLVLLCSAASDNAQRATRWHATSVTPGELPAILARLMRVDTPDPRRLVSSWMLVGRTWIAEQGAMKQQVAVNTSRLDVIESSVKMKADREVTRAEHDELLQRVFRLESEKMSPCEVRAR